MTLEDLLARFTDQDFSYVAATAFITMRRLELQDAFTFDYHFAVVGSTVITAGD
jgi:predicted nucleic acid-binding protein